MNAQALGTGQDGEYARVMQMVGSATGTDSKTLT